MIYCVVKSHGVTYVQNQTESIQTIQTLRQILKSGKYHITEGTNEDGCYEYYVEETGEHVIVMEDDSL